MVSSHRWPPLVGETSLTILAGCGVGRCTGQVRPIEARLPSSIAALGLVLGVSLLATHRFGPVTGLLAGAIQATTAWAVLRGRLAEADILLACVITWTVVAFDRLRAVPGSRADTGGAIQGVYSLSFWQWTFFGLLGVLSLIKGIGFGAVLVLSIVLPVVFWDRDSRLTSQLCTPLGWGVVGVLTMAWPLAMIREHGDKAISLWLLHVVDRISTSTTHKVFASESWPEYCLNILGQGLPWTPLAIIGMYASGSRVLGPGTSRNARKVRQPITNPQRGERLLWAWTLAPLILVSVPSCRNAHYAIHAMIPWSIWSASGLSKVMNRLKMRGWPNVTVRRSVLSVLTTLAAFYGLGFWLIGPRFDHSAQNGHSTRW